jgi:hypothetical protein
MDKVYCGTCNEEIFETFIRWEDNRAMCGTCFSKYVHSMYPSKEDFENIEKNLSTYGLNYIKGDGF